MLRPEQIGNADPSARLWVVAGDEPLLIEECTDDIRRRLREAGFDERSVAHVDRHFDWDGFAVECASPSLFAPRRLFELRFQAALDARSAAAMRGASDAAGPDCAVLAVAGALDGRARKTKWFRELDAATALVYCWRIRPDAMTGWLRDRLTSTGLRHDPGVPEAIAACSEGNLLAAAQLVRQLGALHEDRSRPLGVAEVHALGADMAQFDPFSLMDAAFAGDAAGALRAVRGLRRRGAELPAVTGGLAYVLRQWAGAQQQYARSGDPMAAARSAGIFPPRAQKLAAALQRSKLGVVQGLQRWLADIDHQAKRGQSSAAWDDLITWTAVASGAVRPDFLPRALCKT